MRSNLSVQRLAISAESLPARVHSSTKDADGNVSKQLKLILLINSTRKVFVESSLVRYNNNNSDDVEEMRQYSKQTGPRTRVVITKQTGPRTRRLVITTHAVQQRANNEIHTPVRNLVSDRTRGGGGGDGGRSEI